MPLRGDRLHISTATESFTPCIPLYCQLSNSPTSGGYVHDTTSVARGVRGIGSEFDVLMAETPFDRLRNTFLLLMVANDVGEGSLMYAFGYVSTNNWWSFPAMFVLKEPIPTLIILAIAFVIGLRRIVSMRGSGETLPRSHLILHRRTDPLAWQARSISASAAPLRRSQFDILGTYLLSSSPALHDTCRKTAYVALGGLLLWLLLENTLLRPVFPFSRQRVRRWHVVTAITGWQIRITTGGHASCASNPSWISIRILSIAVRIFGSADVRYLGNRAVDWSPSQGSPADSVISPVRRIHKFARSRRPSRWLRDSQKPRAARMRAHPVCGDPLPGMGTSCSGLPRRHDDIYLPLLAQTYYSTMQTSESKNPAISTMAIG